MVFTDSRSRGRIGAVLAALMLLAAMIAISAGPVTAGGRGPGSDRGLAARTVDVQLLAINDFHGNIEPPSGSSARVLTEAGPVENNGGVEYLATHIRQLEATNPNTLTVAAGDLIGASPLISGYFHDEPTIEAMNALGLDISSVGNHEFDEGYQELLRMQNGGCHPTDGCQDGDGFGGADFQYLSANVFYAGTNETVFPAYEVRKFGGVKIAFVGLTLEGTPSIVTPAGVAGLEFRDEAETINALVPTLQKQNIQSIVVLLHEGLAQTPSSAAFVNTCNGASGALVDIVAHLDPAVDMVISGHTHQQYNCSLPNSVGENIAVSSASSFGRVLTDVDLKIDRATRDIYEVAVNNVIVTRNVAKDPAETAIIAKYAAIVDVVRNAIIGSIAGDLVRAQVVDESTLGNAIADAQLEAMTSLGAQFAVMNPGGIRADLLCGVGETAPCDVTFGEVFAVQPFQNDLVALNLTGAQIDDLLEQQFNNPGPGENRFLSVSSNFTYQYNPAGAQGDKVIDSSIMLNGTVLDPATAYRLTGNSFLTSGTGDNFTVFAQATDRTIGPVDSQAFVDYIGAHSPVAIPALDRVNVAP
jgi:5'-nucleotidase